MSELALGDPNSIGVIYRRIPEWNFIYTAFRNRAGEGDVDGNYKVSYVVRRIQVATILGNASFFDLFEDRREEDTI